MGSELTLVDDEQPRAFVVDQDGTVSTMRCAEWGGDSTSINPFRSTTT